MIHESMNIPGGGSAGRQAAGHVLGDVRQRCAAPSPFAGQQHWWHQPRGPAEAETHKGSSCRHWPWRSSLLGTCSHPYLLPMTAHFSFPCFLAGCRNVNELELQLFSLGFLALGMAGVCRVSCAWRPLVRREHSWAFVVMVYTTHMPLHKISKYQPILFFITPEPRNQSTKRGQCCIDLHLPQEDFLLQGRGDYWLPTTAVVNALDRPIMHQTVKAKHPGAWSLHKRLPDRQFHGLSKSPNSEVNIDARRQLMRWDSSMLLSQISRQRWTQDE